MQCYCFSFVSSAIVVKHPAQICLFCQEEGEWRVLMHSLIYIYTRQCWNLKVNIWIYQTSHDLVTDTCLDLFGDKIIKILQKNNWICWFFLIADVLCNEDGITNKRLRSVVDYFFPFFIEFHETSITRWMTWRIVPEMNSLAVLNRWDCVFC